MTLDQAQFIMAVIVPILMLAIKIGVMWSLWSLLMAATEFFRAITKRIQREP